MSSQPYAPGRVIVDAMPGGIMRVCFSNPARYNAMSLSMWKALSGAVAQAAENPATRLILLEGDGGKAFVSGADISEFGAQRNSPEQVERYGAAVADAQNALMASPVPTIARIRGVCIGGGLALALCCDLRYCNDGARFRMPAARLGLGYALDGVKRMVDILGLSRSADLFMTARMFSGQEAARIGMVHESFPDDRFDALSEERIQAVAANAPLTIRAARLALRHLAGGINAPDSTTVDQAVLACFNSQDYQEGQAAFLEKRLPRFKSN